MMRVIQWAALLLTGFSLGCLAQPESYCAWTDVPVVHASDDVYSQERDAWDAALAKLAECGYPVIDGSRLTMEGEFLPADIDINFGAKSVTALRYHNGECRAAFVSVERGPFFGYDLLHELLHAYGKRHRNDDRHVLNWHRPRGPVNLQSVRGLACSQM